MSSSKCPNCGANLSCGCQRKAASNGASVCSGCLGHYERTLTGKSIPKQSNTPIFPGIQPDSGQTAPSNVQIEVTHRNL